MQSRRRQGTGMPAGRIPQTRCGANLQRLQNGVFGREGSIRPGSECWAAGTASRSVHRG